MFWERAREIKPGERGTRGTGRAEIIVQTDRGPKKSALHSPPFSSPSLPLFLGGLKASTHTPQAPTAPPPALDLLFPTWFHYGALYRPPDGTTPRRPFFLFLFCVCSFLLSLLKKEEKIEKRFTFSRGVGSFVRSFVWVVRQLPTHARHWHQTSIYLFFFFWKQPSIY